MRLLNETKSQCRCEIVRPALKIINACRAWRFGLACTMRGQPLLYFKFRPPMPAATFNPVLPSILTG
jgi:hypothetical protein